MSIVKTGIVLAVAILALVFFSLSSSGVVLFVLWRKIPGSNLSSVRDEFACKAKLVFGNTLIQRAVIRCILWGMSVVILFANLLLRFRQIWIHARQKLRMH